MDIGTIEGALKLRDEWGPQLASIAKATVAQLKNISGAAATVSAAMASTFGVAAIAAIADGTTQAIKFEQAFAGVRKTVEGSKAELDAISDSFLEMSTRIPVTVEELSKIGETAGQLGIAKQSIVEFTDTIAALAVSTNLTAEEAATSFAQFQNILGTTGTGIERMGAAVVDLGNKGASSEKDITQMALRIASAGKAAGMTEADVLGLAAGMANLGIRAEKGGSAVSVVLSKMGKAVDLGGEKLKAFADLAQMSTQKFAAAFKKDAASAFVDVVAGLERVREAGGNVTIALEKLGITEIRQSDVMRAASGNAQLLADTLRQSHDAYRENSALVQESGKYYATTENQLKTLTNTWRALRIEIGQAFLPILTEAIAAIRPMVQWLAELGKQFRDLPEGTRRAVAGIVALAAVALPLKLAFDALKIAMLLGYAWDIVAGGFKMLAGVMTGTLIPAVAKTAAAFKELALMTAAFGAEGFVVTLQGWGAAIAKVLPGITLLTKGWAEVRAATALLGAEGLLLVLKDWGAALLRVTGIAAGFGRGVALLTNPITATIAAIVALVAGVRYLTGSWQATWDILKFLVPPIWAAVEAYNGIKTAITALTPTWNALVSLMRDLYTVGSYLVSTTLTALVSWLRDKLSSALAWVTEKWQAFLQWLQPAVDIIRDVGSYVAELAREMLAAIAPTISFNDALKGMVVVLDIISPGFSRLVEAVGGIGDWFSKAGEKLKQWRGDLHDTAEAVRAEAPKIMAPLAFSPDVQSGKFTAMIAPLVTAGRDISNTFNVDVDRALMKFFDRTKDMSPAEQRMRDGFAKIGTAAGEMSKAAKRAAEELKDAIKEMSGRGAVEEASKLMAALKGIGSIKIVDPAAMAGMIDTLQSAVDAVGRLGGAATAAERAQVAAWKNTIAAMQPLSKAYQDQQAEMATWAQAAKGDIAKIDASVGEWSTEQNALTEAIRKTNNELTRNAAVRGASKEFKALAGEIFKTSDEVEDLERQFRSAEPGAQALIRTLIEGKEANLSDTFWEMAESVPEFTAALAPLMVVFPQLMLLFNNFDEHTTKKMPKEKEALKALGESVGGLATAFTQLSQVSGEGMAGFGKAMAEIITSADVGLKSLETVQKGLKDWTKALASDTKIGLASAFAEIATGLVSGFANIMSISSTASTMQRAVQGAISGAGMGAAVAGVGAAIAGASVQGAAVAGAWGAAAGAVVGIFIGVFKGRATRKEMKDVGRIWGLTITEGMAEQNKKIAKEMFGGDARTAELFNMKKMLDDSMEGLNADNMSSLMARLRDVFVAYETGAFTAAQAQQVLNDNFGAFASMVVDSGRIASTQFQELIKLNAASGLYATDILNFVSEKTALVADGLAALAGPLLASIEVTKKGFEEGNVSAEQMATFTANAASEINDLGIIAVGAFGAARAAGLTFVEAVAAMGPGLDALILAQQQLGITSDNVALNQLTHFRDLVNGNQTLVTATEALNTTMLALSQTGGLNTDTLKAMESQGLRTFQRLTEAGFSEQEALAMMADFLKNVIEAHEQLGVPIDENTAALIEQADKYGLLRRDGKSATDLLDAGFKTLTAGINELIRVLGGVPVKFEEIADKINKIPKDIDVNVNGRYNPPEGIPMPGSDDGYGMPHAAKGGIALGPTVGLWGEAGPEALIPLDRLDEFGGGGRTQYIVVNLDGEPILTYVGRNLGDYVELHGA